MSWLINNFDNFSSKVAIVHKDIEYTYQQLSDEISKIKDILLDNNIQKGQVIAILGDYSFHNIALLLALYKNKNIIVPITTIVENEIQDKIEESFTDIIISVTNEAYKIKNLVSNEKHAMIKSLQQSENSGLILFSSGSTGKPKAMIHNFDNLIDHYKEKKKNQ